MRVRKTKRVGWFTRLSYIGFSISVILSLFMMFLGTAVESRFIEELIIKCLGAVIVTGISTMLCELWEE